MIERTGTENLKVSEEDKPLTMVTDNWMQTYTGVCFPILKPEAKYVNIQDIAHALGHLCRYNGACLRFYSVAEHSVLMTVYWMSQIEKTKKLEAVDYNTLLTILLHDSAEAYLGDMVRPVKHLIPQFKEMEEKIDQVVAEHFGTIYPFPAIVKELDNRVLVDERTQNMHITQEEWFCKDLEPLEVKLGCWSPETASIRFMILFNDLIKWRQEAILEENIVEKI